MTSDPYRTIRELQGIGQALAHRIVEELGDGDPHAALGLIERNPYSLVDVNGIGFLKADKIALTDYHVGNDDPRRHLAGNRHILEQRGCLSLTEYHRERQKKNLMDHAFAFHGARQEDARVWLPEELAAEQGLADWMLGLPEGPARQAGLSEQQRAIVAAMHLDEVQQAAVATALANPVTLLTGGAGTGKTHIVAALCRCLQAEGHSARGMAFAGKAADRMREAFGQYGVATEASTIHKALGYMGRQGFTLDAFSERLIVIDEASMLPNTLLWEVVRRLEDDQHLVLVGDDAQLPPIGYGTPFVDLLRHGAARAHLSRNYRQQDQQGILHLSEGVRDRKRVAPDPACVDMHLGIDGSALGELFDGLVREHGGLDFEAWQAITWRNEDAQRYNLRAQAVLNPGGEPLFEYPCWELGRVPGSNRPAVLAEVRVGDKIIVVKNSTQLNIFNGQTGTAQDLVQAPLVTRRKNKLTGEWEEHTGPSTAHLQVLVSGRRVLIPLEEVKDYVQLGYVITVHKAQGSDWDRVIIMQPGKVRDEMARRWYYTSLTRAKKRLVIVSSLRPIGWWTNAASDAPDEPSSLIERMKRDLQRVLVGGDMFRSEYR